MLRDSWTLKPPEKLTEEALMGPIGDLCREFPMYKYRGLPNRSTELRTTKRSPGSCVTNIGHADRERGNGLP